MPTSRTPVTKSFKYDHLSHSIPTDWEKLPPPQRDVLTAIRLQQMGAVERAKAAGVSMVFEENMPWREAILSDNLLCVRFLITKCGVDVNCECGFGLRWAACKGYVDILNELFDHDANPAFNDHDVLQIAKNSGAHIERKIHCYVHKNMKTIPRPQRIQLMDFVQRGNVMELHRVINHNPRFDFACNNNLLLREAVLSGHLGVVQFLIEKGNVDIDAEQGFGIRYACKLGFGDIVNYFLRNNAIVSLRNREAYRWALHMGYRSIAEQLRKHDPHYRRHPDEFHLEEDAYRWQSPARREQPPSIKYTPFTRRIINEIAIDSDDDFLQAHRKTMMSMEDTSSRLQTPVSQFQHEEPWPNSA